MDILKYKFKDGEHIIKYINSKNDEVEIKSKDDALPELNNSLADLAPFVIEICEEPETSDITITGISISRNEDHEGFIVHGAVIIARKKLCNSTGVI
ncbi:MAG: hypothetical protein ABFS12_13965, partial [Bacteroidota bacterium]